MRLPYRAIFHFPKPRMLKIFVDGQHGTTGLEIHRLLAGRSEFELLEVAPADKKDPKVRHARLNEADAVVLCLPDEAAIDAVALIESPEVRVLDASTAFRTHSGWVYGLPELPDQRQRLLGAKRVSNPGCYPTGFLLAVRPLIAAGVLPPALPLSVHAVSGYSGGGRKLIEKFEALAQQAQSPDQLLHAQAYGLGLKHKHVAEMQHYSGTRTTPLFAPSVGHFYRGMLVCVPLFVQQLVNQPAHSPGGAAARQIDRDEVQRIWRDAYAGEAYVQVLEHDSQLSDGYLDPQGANFSNRVELMVYGNSEQLLLIARLDNLGKGAAGAAVQNLNLMLGLPEATGLPTGERPISDQRPFSLSGMGSQERMAELAGGSQ